MNRFFGLALIASLSTSSVAFAGETLSGLAARVTRDAVQSQTPPSPKSAAQSVPKNWAGVLAAQDLPAVSTSGMRKRTKFLIFLAAGVGFAAATYAIDHSVEDNTPSSLGLRED